MGKGPVPVYAGLIRAERLWIGTLDAAGNFVVNYRMGPFLWSRTQGGGGSFNFSFVFLNVTGDDYFVPAYEHRSGRLLKGMLTPDGAFVPDLGSRVMALEDHPKELETPDIYNRPAQLYDRVRFQKVVKAAEEKYASGKRMPRFPPPREANAPFGFRLEPLIRFSGREGPPWFAHVRGQEMALGHLDQAGDFVPDPGLPPLPLVRPVQAVNGPTGEPVPILYNLPREGEREDVYEYRSGRLLQGTLLKNGTFVPDLHSKVLELKDYVPGAPGGRRIYNLPGRLVKER
jgi:hypothetical protein